MRTVHSAQAHTDEECPQDATLSVRHAEIFDASNSSEDPIPLPIPIVLGAQETIQIRGFRGRAELRGW